MGRAADAFFGRKRKKRVELTPDIPYLDGEYQAVWEKQRMPSPGAMNYAWEVLGLVQFTPIGPSVFTRQPIIPFAQTQQSITVQRGAAAGLPTVSGNMRTQALVNPDGTPQGSPSTPIFNIPFAHGEIAWAGAGTLS